MLQGDYWGDHSWYRGDADDVVAKEAYQALMRIALYLPSGSHWDEFTTEVRRRSLDKYGFDFKQEKVKVYFS